MLGPFSMNPDVTNLISCTNKNANQECMLAFWSESQVECETGES